MENSTIYDAIKVLILSITPVFLALVYRKYKMPKEIIEVIQSKEAIHKEVIKTHMNSISRLETENKNLLEANKEQMKTIQKLSTFMLTLPDLNALQNGNAHFSSLLNRFIRIYRIIEMDGYVNTPMDGSYFNGSDGAHVSSNEENEFIKMGLIDKDPQRDEYTLTEKGKIFGEYYPDTFKSNLKTI